MTYKESITVFLALLLLITTGCGGSGPIDPEKRTGDTYIQTWGAVGKSFTSGMTSNDSGDMYVLGYVGSHPPGSAGHLLPGNTINPISVEDTISMYLSKFDRGGILIWSLAWATSSYDSVSGQDVACDSEGNIYIAGTLRGQIDLDPGLATSESGAEYNAYFLMKLSQAGLLKWARVWGENYTSSPLVQLDVSNSGRIMVAGEWEGSIDFDPGPGQDIRTSYNSYYYYGMAASGDSMDRTVASPPIPEMKDLFLMQFNSDGDHFWSRTWGGFGDEAFGGLAVDESGNAYVCGSYWDWLDCANGIELITSSGSRDTFLCKYDNAGNPVWIFGIGGEDTDDCGGVAIDGGGVYLTGSFGQEVDFDPGPGEAIHTATNSERGYYDSYLCKYDPDGSYIWSRTWGGGSAWDGAYGVAVSTDSVWVQGVYRDEIDLDPGPGEDCRPEHRDWYNANHFLSKYDFDGNYLGARTWSMDNYDYCRGLVPGYNGGVWVTGWYADSNPFSGGCMPVPTDHIYVRGYLSWYSTDTLP